MTLLELLDRPIAFHRPFATITGSINAALFLSQALYWTNRSDAKGGWFYKTQSEWFDETFLSRRDQETARHKLVEMGILNEERRGVPARMFYCINKETLTVILRNAPSRQSSMAPNAILDCLQAPDRNGWSGQSITETTQETTTEKNPKAPVGATVLSSNGSKLVGFDAFWNAYPKKRRTGKGAAMKSWVKHNCHEIKETIVLSVAACCETAQWKKSDNRFVPHPTTWLNEKRWLDDVQPVEKPPMSEDEIF